MDVKINNPNSIIIKELEKVLKDLNSAKACLFDDYDAGIVIERAKARIEVIKGLLEE